jgi:tol-pal system protein YbgF
LIRITPKVRENQRSNLNYKSLIVVLIGCIALSACYKQDPVREQNVRDLEEEIILLKLKLQETENRLSERIRVLELQEMANMLDAEQQNLVQEATVKEAAPKMPAEEAEPEVTKPQQEMVTATEPDPVPEQTPPPTPASSGDASTDQPVQTEAYGDALYGTEDTGPVDRDNAYAPVEETTSLNEPADTTDTLAATPPQISTSAIRSEYNRASKALSDRQYQKAESLFQAIVEQHPNHRLAPNALYWWGESAYAQRQYEQAITRFQSVMDRYPESNKAPDALLKLGKSHERTGDITSAKEAYRQVIAQFPESRAAQIAQTWL